MSRRALLQHNSGEWHGLFIRLDHTGVEQTRFKTLLQLLCEVVVRPPHPAALRFSCQCRTEFCEAVRQQALHVLYPRSGVIWLHARLSRPPAPRARGCQ